MRTLNTLLFFAVFCPAALTSIALAQSGTELATEIALRIRISSPFGISLEAQIKDRLQDCPYIRLSENATAEVIVRLGSSTEIRKLWNQKYQQSKFPEHAQIPQLGLMIESSPEVTTVGGGTSYFNRQIDATENVYRSLCRPSDQAIKSQFPVLPMVVMLAPEYAKSIELCETQVHRGEQGGSICSTIVGVTGAANEIAQIVHGYKVTDGSLIEAGTKHAMPLELRLSSADDGLVLLNIYDAYKGQLVATRTAPGFRGNKAMDEVESISLANWLFSISESYLKKAVN